MWAYLCICSHVRKIRSSYLLLSSVGQAFFGCGPCCLQQTARHTQLERAKHCLVLLKKTSRALTASSWKQLRLRMEQDLASKLQQQQADLEDQMACAQVGAAVISTMPYSKSKQCLYGSILWNCSIGGVVMQAGDK
eukprot:GHRR01033876.1.p1 GENE.GHRR01033876.1~~GHRR01033876.1.p1  ORF type:complete len:136 (-),score=40.69 GHRR01033876.1:174-581(-)